MGNFSHLLNHPSFYCCCCKTQVIEAAPFHTQLLHALLIDTNSNNHCPAWPVPGHHDALGLNGSMDFPSSLAHCFFLLPQGALVPDMCRLPLTSTTIRSYGMLLAKQNVEQKQPQSVTHRAQTTIAQNIRRPPLYLCTDFFKVERNLLRRDSHSSVFAAYWVYKITNTGTYLRFFLDFLQICHS